MKTDAQIQSDVTAELMWDPSVTAANIGVAVHDGRNEETAQELLHRADAAMYRAKAAGKRRVAF